MTTRAWWVAMALAWAAAPAWAAPAAATTGGGAGDPALWNSEKNSCRELPPAASTRLGLIRQMLVAGKPHAAIAYLDAARIEAPQAELLRADGLRQTGREEEADRLYRKLLGSCVAGYAYQGLGLSASSAGRLREAVAHLKAASEALPVDPSVRNDYGYALMLAGDSKPAMHEFLTAIELAPSQRRAAHNLLLLLLRTGEENKATAFAEQYGIPAGELEEIRQMAGRQLPAMAPSMTPAMGMTGPLVGDKPVSDEATNRNETGASDENESESELGGHVAADRPDSVR